MPYVLYRNSSSPQCSTMQRRSHKPRARAHRKNVVNLYKIHAQCVAISEEVPGRGIKLTGEKAFNDAFLDMVNRVLPIKKGVSNGDKIVKFCGAFVEYLSEKGKRLISTRIYPLGLKVNQPLQRRRMTKTKTTRTMILLPRDLSPPF